MATWDCDGVQLGNVLVFCKVGEAFGGLSNMSNAYPLELNGRRICATEALYQACRYPDQPEWQREILAAPHAYQSKMIARKQGRLHFTRSDWNNVREDVMWYCLQLKMAQHGDKFARLLLATGFRPIVERSWRDKYWGAVEKKDGVLRGENRLGVLLSRLRDDLRGWLNEGDEPSPWPEPDARRIENFRLPVEYTI